MSGALPAITLHEGTTGYPAASARLAQVQFLPESAGPSEPFRILVMRTQFEGLARLRFAIFCATRQRELAGSRLS